MKLHVYQGAGSGLWYWRLVARNGKIVGDSGEGYDTRYNAKRAWRRIEKIVTGRYVKGQRIEVVED